LSAKTQFLSLKYTRMHEDPRNLRVCELNPHC
jgi:hypothetical protein